MKTFLRLVAGLGIEKRFILFFSIWIASPTNSLFYLSFQSIAPWEGGTSGVLALPRVEGALNSVLGMSSRFLRTAEHPAAENLPMLRGVIRSSHE